MYRFLLFFAIGLIMTNALLATEAATYEVSNVETRHGEKISMNIVVSRPITETELVSTARSLYKLFRGPTFKRVFIDWYLPGMVIDSGVWATTHFTPRLHVNIMTWMLEHNPPYQPVYAE